MTAFKKGDTVTLKTVTPTGEITKLRMDEDGVVYYLMQWTAEDGTTHERWFTDDQLVAAG